MRRYFGLFLLVSVLFLTSCASTSKIIEHANLQTKVTLVEPIFLNVAAPKRTAFVKVTNTSDVQGIPLEDALRDRLSKKNVVIVSDPAEAHWIVQVNVTSLVYQKVGSMGQEASQVGAVIGGIAGALIPGSGRDSWIGAAAGSIAGNIVGAVAGSLVKVESYAGLVDLQIQERLTQMVKGKMKSEVKQGTSTTYTTERDVESEYQTYRTLMRIEATRTNIDLEEVKREIAGKVADQIAGLF
ncbi:MAG: complement resistance protein TraT [Deltaproteobacteria bacterium]|nr:complement resistance protein TraT [Deltaproteobacteria bacterium]